MEQVCRHFQTGFCKFGELCRKHHVKVICDKENCDSKDCNERHPKICRYFNSNQVCKFGSTCSYLHVTLKEKGEIFLLNSKVNQLESLIKSMSQKIDKLSIELEVVKTKKEINTNDIPSEKEIKCEVCEYTASSGTVLKRHVTMKHKKNEQSVEAPNQFKCEVCDHECNSSSALQSHISKHHEPTIPHTPKQCFLTNCTNMTNNIEEDIYIYDINYTNIPICEACLEGA